MIESRAPRRTLFEALGKARLRPPLNDGDLAEIFLLLLLLGLDHDLVGSPRWHAVIASTAPRLDERTLDDEARRGREHDDEDGA
jgi:hypothetical protein